MMVVPTALAAVDQAKSKTSRIEVSLIGFMLRVQAVSTLQGKEAYNHRSRSREAIEREE